MDELNAEETLYQMWMVYKTKNDVSLFKEYLNVFLETYDALVDKEFAHFSDGFTDEGPHLTRLPEGLLQVISKQLCTCSEELAQSLQLQPLQYAEQLTKCLVIVCRNIDNIALVASCEFVTHIVTTATVVLSKLSSENTENVDKLTHFVQYCLHFLECLYDPYFIWRKKLRGWTVDKNRCKHRPALLHVEVVPFFYECFQQVSLDTDLQTRLFHVFGAIISGCQSNALRAICPATMDVLLKVLAAPSAPGPTDEAQVDLMTLKDLVLKCVIRMVHVIHGCSPDQRQVEVGAVLEGYFQVLLSQEGQDDLNHVTLLQLKMLNAINEMLICTDKSALQVIFVAEGTFDTFITFLQKTTLTGVEAQRMAMAILRVMNSVMMGSTTAKEKFREKIGYTKFVEALKSLGQPSRELLSSILDLVVEATYERKNDYPIRNAQAALMLVQWLPDIQSHELQIWLSQCLLELCRSGNHNRMHCCNDGMIASVLGVLGREKEMDPQCVGNLIDLLESLGTLSITASELKQLIGLMKPDKEGKQMKYLGRLMHAMSKMARREGREGALHYFDFQAAEAGITIPGIRKWPGQGFTFHAWLCLEHHSSISVGHCQLNRRRLYSITSSAGGFEAFFTLDGILVVSVSTKREYHSIAVTECPIVDQQWHSVDIVHTSSKRPFTHSQLTVYIDGRQRLSAQIKFPVVTEPFTVCHVGSPGIKTASPDGSVDFTSMVPESKPKLLGGFRLPLLNSLKTQTVQSPMVNTVPCGMEDTHFGVPVSLCGQLGSVCVFHEAISAAQVKSLNALGPNHLTLFQSEENSVAELESKVVVHYNAKACKGTSCIDLSFNQNHGRLLGSKCVTWDIKDVINCIGGVQVLFPLMEQVQKTAEGEMEEVQIKTLSTMTSKSDDKDDWIVVPSSSYADSKLEQNQVAGFLTLVRNMIQSSPVNQDNLVRMYAVPTLGVLLQKVDPELIDVHVLMAIQLLVEAIAASNKTLLHTIYQYLLFDFRIWSRSEFPVRIGHIQYLSTIIKDDRKYFRKKYGVQYMLDVIRTYYGASEECCLPEEDKMTIRGSLLGLVKYYVVREITYEELQQILSFIVSSSEETLASEAMDLLMALLESPGKRDQIYLLMFEPEAAELLYGLLVSKRYRCTLKEKILKVFGTLLRSDRVYDKSKTRLRLLDNSLFAGFTSLLSVNPISLEMSKALLSQVLLTDSAASYDAAISVIQLLHGADIVVKLEATKKLLVTLFTKTNAPKLFAKSLGWQEALARLFIMKNDVPSNSTKHAVPTDTANQSQPDSVTSSQVSGDPGTNQNAETPVTANQNEERKSSDLMSHDFLASSFSSSKNESLSDHFENSVDSTMFQMMRRMSRDDSCRDGNEGGVLPGTDMSSPQYLKAAIFEDNQVDMEYLNLYQSSRSSSTSVEDLSQGGMGRSESSHMVNSASAVSLQNSESATSISSIDAGLFGQESRPSQGEAQIALGIKKLGLAVDFRDEQMEKTEELCQNLLIILFTILWKGVEGSGKTAWKERGQVYAAICYTNESHRLLKPKTELTRKLIEMMLQNCITEVKESAQSQPTLAENSMEVVKIVYDFVCLDPSPPCEKFSERLIDDLIGLLDLLAVWDPASEWREMSQLGLSIILTFAAQDDLDLCAVASARLHTLLQTRPVDKLQEACYVMAAINEIIMSALAEQRDHYSFLMPVMKALVDKCHDLLNMETYLPSLPATAMSPTFFDDFKAYCLSEEWQIFIVKQVLPSMEQYVANNYDETKVAIKTHLGQCHEDMMINSHKRSRERGESKLRFQSQMLELYKLRCRQESKRYINLMTQMRNQHATSLRQWRATKAFFTGERGAWMEQILAAVHWKLSTQENFSRMRPKTVQNYNFDNHAECSLLRDNMGVEDTSTPTLPALPLVKDAKVADEDIGDDRLGDEEWNVISTASTASDDSAGREKLVLSEDCELVTMMDIFKGRLEVTTTHVYFFDSNPFKDEGGGEDFKWALSQLREIHFRRYNLRRSALELFLVDQSNYFLNFQKKTEKGDDASESRRVRNKVYSRILSLRPPNLIYHGSRSPAELLKSSNLTQKWVNREITNFDYLMQLNTIAGRTYNDLSQYPVFPWILCDFTSDELDLDDPKVYRDLSKPIGVVNPKNEREVREKFDHFEDPTGTIEKFHYGTHYSNSAGVMHYLIRMEPFTTLHIQLQSGRFDVADRQFHSIPSTWSSLMENPNDVKELIPEFFYLPEFLENSNKFNLGRLQVTHEVVDDVVLPPWAKSAEDFINKHRKALESEFVSSHLHEWIDLIFGYKQKGPSAVEALNVFYYCTYEGAVDLDAITDPIERKAVEGMINNFGQTPCQLLKEPHPRRMSFEESVHRAQKYDRPLSILLFWQQLKAFYVEVSTDIDPLAYVCVPRNQARSFIQHGMPDSMLTVTEEGFVGVHGWLPYDKSISNYFTFEKDPTLLNSRSRKNLSGPFAPGLKINPKLFVASHDAKLIFSGGHWDNSLRVYNVGKARTVAHIVRHTDIITCVALDYCGNHLITGSRDTTCMIWQMSQSGGVQNLGNKPIQILYGHDGEVTSVAISIELDMAVSGSKCYSGPSLERPLLAPSMKWTYKAGGLPREDGTVIVHSVRKGHYMHTLRPPCERPYHLVIKELAISDVGQIAIFAQQYIPGKSGKEDKMALHVYSINGKHLSTERLSHAIMAMVIADGHLVTGNSQGMLSIRQLFGLRHLTTMPLHVPVQCLSVTNGNSHVLAGLRDGKLIIVGIKKQSEVR